MFKDKEILQELRQINTNLQTINKKIEQFVLVSKKREFIAKIKQGGDK